MTVARQLQGRGPGVSSHVFTGRKQRRDGSDHPPDPPGIRRRGVGRRSPPAFVAGRGCRHRGGDGPLRSAGVPRPGHHRRAAGRVQPQFRRDRELGRRQRDPAGAEAARPADERRLQSRRGPQAAGARRPPPPVQPRQPAVAFRQLVPRRPGEVFAALGPHRRRQGRPHRVRRHARRLRFARRRYQGRSRRPRLRAFADLFARAARLYRTVRRGARDVPPGAPEPGADPPGDRAQIAVPVLACRHHRRLAGAGGARLSARPDRARDAAGKCLCPPLAALRPSDVGQPPDDAPGAPLRRDAGTRHAPHHGGRRCADRSAGRRGLTRAETPLRGEAAPVANRGMITLSIMLANIMQGVDNTIANVALPHIQGSLSASQDQIAWVLTSYIVAAAIMMPLTGWLAGRLGIKYVFLASVGGFTVASALCGAATSLSQLVVYRALQGLCGAGLIPLSQATLLQINPPERHGHAMAVFGIGTILGPISGPLLGGWLTDNYSWRWIFYVNLPVGILCTLGILVFIRQTRTVHREAFDFFGFLTLSLGVGALQLMLDRGELKDWFGSTEIWVEAIVAGLAFYLFVVHTATATDRSFLNRELMRDANCMVGTLLMFIIGIPLYGTMTLLPTMLQDLLNYPVVTTGLVTAPRGIGTMVAMILVARLANRIDTRLIILGGLMVTAVAMWQMTGFSLYMGMAPVVVTGVLQGFGLGFVFTPLSIITFSTLPRHMLTQGTAIFSLMRNIGGSVGISIVEALLAQNTQIVHSQLVEHLRPDNPMAWRALKAPFSLTAPSGIAALNAEATRQAAMVAYIDDFMLMMILVVVGIPLLMLLRRPRRAAPGAAVAAE